MLRIVVTTTDKLENARTLARHLVEEHLAACVNIVPEIRSVYRWAGSLEESVECLLIIKTTEDRIETLIPRIRELHGYDLPEIVVLPVDTGLEEYLQWVRDETRLPKDQELP